MIILNNPYDYLGVSRNSEERQIMDAYRRLAGQIQNSDMSDEEKKLKMKELDDAYDTVLAEKRGTTAYQSGGSSYYDSSYNNASDSQFADIRAQLNSGRIDDAETVLDGIPSSMRTAEWYFLKGVIHQRRGWLNEAYRCYQTACRLDPQNPEYAAALNSMNNNAKGAYKTSRSSGGLCDICSGLLCGDCCCECMGGDLIPCC